MPILSPKLPSELTVEELIALQNSYKASDKEDTRIKLYTCTGTGCSAKGSLKVAEALEKEITAKDAGNRTVVKTVNCNGFCSQGPIVRVSPEETVYEKVKAEDASAIVDEHVLGGKPVEKLFYKDPVKKIPVAARDDIAFYRLQTHRVLGNLGDIDPECIDDYFAKGGYLALAKAMKDMTPKAVIREIMESGLKGRGGAGFPTGLKWEICADANADKGLSGGQDGKYVICNAGPIARSLIEIDPQAIVEGMIIAALAIGASQGYIYLREPENLFVLDRLTLVLNQARDYGLLGDNILHRGFVFDITLYRGAGTFICGEETALIASIEGTRGYPSPKPPYPANRGLFGQPTIVDSAETFANVPLIIRNGAQWFKSVGADQCTGTKIFALSGVNSSGLIEVPMGTSIKTVVNDIGGGLPKKSTLKAIQIGGPTGGYIPESLIDLPLTFEDVQKAGVIIGSGNVIALDHTTCLVNDAMFAMEFAVAESCGKCVPCRIGTNWMHDKLKEITQGKAKEKDMELLEELAGEVKRTSLCGFGRTAPLAVLTTLKYFRDEYVSHIRDRWCPSGVCKELSVFYIDEKVCTGCTSCARKCPQNTIVGEKKKPHFIKQEGCVKCRSCYLTCTFHAVKVGPAGMFASETAPKEESQ